MPENGTHTYQWMVFSPDRLQQWVVRSDDQESFMEAYLFVQNLVADALIPSLAEVAQNGTAVDTEPPIAKDVCPIHNKPMKERQAKHGGTYYDHRWQINGIWHICNGASERTQSGGK